LAKLTLSIDERVVSRAKRFASRRGTSISRLVERYLEIVSSARRPEEPAPPVLRRLRGIAKGVDPESYRRHLERKHG
jgi:hypothetical protein